MRFFRKILILFFLFLFALIPRIHNLSETPIYPDEITWMVRGKESFFAIKHGDFDYFRNAWWERRDDTEAIGLPLAFTTGISLVLLGKDQSAASLELFPDFIAARIPTVVANSLFIVLFFLVAEKFLPKRVALLATLLLAVDPVHVAFSRFVLQDSFLTIFTFFAVSAYMLREQLKTFFVSSSLAAAFLTKPNGLLVLGSWAIFTVFAKQRAKELSEFLKNSIFAFILVTLFWPAAWFSPVTAIPEYLYRQLTLVNQGITNFFLGEITTNPSLFYYPFQFLSRLPVPVLIIAIITLLLASKSFKKQGFSVNAQSAIVFFLLFLVTISLAPKKLGIRYALPLWPWLYLFSAWGVSQLTENFGKKLFTPAAVLLIFSNIWSLVSYSPNFHLYYNSLIGGPSGAQKYDLIELCFGTKEAIEFINTCYPTSSSISIVGCGNSTGAYYYSKEISKQWKDADFTILENSFKRLLPGSEIVESLEKQTPVSTVTQKGAILAYVYLNNKELVNYCNR